MNGRKFQALDFDSQDADIRDDAEWWRMQDQELEQEEMDRLEIEAEIAMMRCEGWM
jgi:hypothetical protein